MLGYIAFRFPDGNKKTSREKFSALLSRKLLKEKDHVNSLPEKAILFSFQLKQAVVFLFKDLCSQCEKELTLTAKLIVYSSLLASGNYHVIPLFRSVNLKRN